MQNICIVNKKMVSHSHKLKNAQKKSRKYYQEKIFLKVNGVVKTTKIRKIVDINEITYKKYTPFDDIENKTLPQLSVEQLIDVCRRAKLTGRSGNGFPTYKKIEAFKSESGVLIINGVECDPGLIHDAWIYRNKIDKVLEAAKLIANSLEIKNIVLATKEPINDRLDISQVKVPDRFPMGYEKDLIKLITGKNIPDGKRPSEYGILVLNLQTVLAIGEIIVDPQKAYEKYITISDISEAKAFVTRVQLGHSVEDIASKIFSDINGKKIYAGLGAFDCHEVQIGEVVTDQICYIAIGNAPIYENAAKCKGCNACTRNCPVGIDVQKIVRLSEKERLTKDMIGALKSSACIGCGTCTYGCVAGKNVKGIVRCLNEMQLEE